jgi:hypothetical protein
MPATTRIQLARLMDYFDNFTRQFLYSVVAPRSVDVELLAPEINTCSMALAWSASRTTRTTTP